MFASQVTRSKQFPTCKPRARSTHGAKIKNMFSVFFTKAIKILTSGSPRRSGKADDDTAAATNSACWPSLNASIPVTGAVREETAAYLSAEEVKALATGRKESGKDIKSRVMKRDRTCELRLCDA